MGFGSRNGLIAMNKLADGPLISEFESYFWPNWRNKCSKKDGLKAFLKVRQEVSLDQIIKGVVRYNEGKPEWQAWMHPATFLNGHRFEDEYEPTTGTAFKEALLAESGLSIVESGGRDTARVDQNKYKDGHVRLIRGTQTGE
jgi:hypothetical protein